MASSSVSQESLDMDDFDTSARRNRIRVYRGHSGRGVAPFRTLPDRGLPTQPIGDHDESSNLMNSGRDVNGDSGEGGSAVSGIVGGANSLVLSAHGHHGADHESPTRSAAARLKDKQRGRPNHMKGKLPKDKRKLREKRRSTGVVHCMPSTESTGDSLDEDDDDELVVHGHDTKKNTVYNEGPGASHHHQNHYEARSSTAYSHPRRNKSPSDLEADLEDNQDYDSTVSHSETNLSLIGRSESSEIPASLPPAPQRSVGYNHNSHYHNQASVSPGKNIRMPSNFQNKTGSTTGRGDSGFSSKFSPDTNRARRFNAGFSNSNFSSNSTQAQVVNNNGSSEADSLSRTTIPSTSSSSAVLSRWRDYPDSSSSPITTAPLSSTRPNYSNLNNTTTSQYSPDSPRRIGSVGGARSSTTDKDVTSSQPASTVSSSGSSGSIGGLTDSPRAKGFSVFRDAGVSSNNNTTGAANNPGSISAATKSVYMGVSSAPARFQDRDGSSVPNTGGAVTSSSLHQRLANYQSPRPYGVPSPGIAQNQQGNGSRNEVVELEKQLEAEREQNKKLQQQLEDKDKKISELEKAIELLNTECDGLDEDNLKLQEENKALIRAMSKLTSNV